MLCLCLHVCLHFTVFPSIILTFIFCILTSCFVLFFHSIKHWQLSPLSHLFPHFLPAFSFTFFLSVLVFFFMSNPTTPSSLYHIFSSPHHNKKHLFCLQHRHWCLTCPHPVYNETTMAWKFNNLVNLHSHTIFHCGCDWEILTNW